MLNFRLVILFSSLAAAPAFAAEPAPSAAEHPCRKIKAACEAAGFVKGGHDKKAGASKGLFMDCMKPIMAGTAVPGVTIDAKTVAECKERKGKRKAHQGAKAAHGEDDSDE